MTTIFKLEIEIAPYTIIDIEITVAPAEPEVGVMSPQVEDVEFFWRPRLGSDQHTIAKRAGIGYADPLTDDQLVMLASPLFLFQEWDYPGDFSGKSIREWLDEWAVHAWESGDAWSDFDD